MSDIQALLFDVFGTVVDWRSCISDEIRLLARQHDVACDAEQLADEWRAQYQPAMEAIRSGQRGFTRLDILHAENLDHVLAANGITSFSAAEKAHLVKAWHRLQGWPDSSAGLYRLKQQFIIAPQSNGNIALSSIWPKPRICPGMWYWGLRSCRPINPGQKLMSGPVMRWV